jgi:tetraacyldisaccharide 4'-kinase
MRGTLETAAQRAWAGRTPGDRALRAALVPAALAYGAAVAVRNTLYDAGWLRARRVPARVVSVGNITVGGTGKTPAALWLAERLTARGRRTAIVTRGYRKRARGIVIVGDAGRALVDAEEGGDEPVMLARRFTGPVVAGARRYEAARFACTRFALDAIVLDDGFQHRALARDADLVLVADDVAAAWPLPAGPLRETAQALGRARAVLAVDGAPAPAGAPVFRGRMRPTALVEAGTWRVAPLDALAGRPVLAVAGIAHPSRFGATLARAGIAAADILAFPDHHRYDAGDARRIVEAARGRPVVTTEKDLVKLERLTVPDLHALRIALEVDDEDALVRLLLGG